MKQIALKTALIFTVIIMFFSCKEDPYAEWKILNDNRYASELDTTKYTKTESGLCYTILYPGEMKRPNKDSYVVVNYTGRLITGEVFDSGTFKSYLSYAVAGWQEAITKLKVGGRMKMFFPYTLGYGKDGYSDIPPYSMLYFDVELVEAQY